MAEDDKNVHQGHRERLRNIVEANGIESLPDHNVLEFLLFYAVPYKDTNVIAHNLLSAFGSLDAVFNAPEGELVKIKNMTRNAAVLLRSIPAVYRKYAGSVTRDKPVLNAGNLIDYLANLLRYRSTESLYVLCLDNNSRLIHTVCLADNVNDITFQIKDVVKIALNTQAYGVVIAHNHPSDNVAPSLADKETTAALAHSLRAMNIIFVDHIIIGNKQAFSFAAEQFFTLDSALTPSD